MHLWGFLPTVSTVVDGSLCLLCEIANVREKLDVVRLLTAEHHAFEHTFLVRPIESFVCRREQRTDEADSWCFTTRALCELDNILHLLSHDTLLVLFNEKNIFEEHWKQELTFPVDTFGAFAQFSVGLPAAHNNGSAYGGYLGGTLLPFSSYVFTLAEWRFPSPRPFILPSYRSAETLSGRTITVFSFLIKNWYAVAVMIPRLLISCFQCSSLKLL